MVLKIDHWIPSPFLLVFLLHFTVITSVNVHKTVLYFNLLRPDNINHVVIKRGIQQSNHPYNTIKEISFRALNRDFRLILTAKRGILHSEFSASTVDGSGNETPVPVDHESFYEGRLFGEKDSSANVHLYDDGMMIANIHLPHETYHIEPSWRHFDAHDNRTMLAYRASDVRFSWETGEPRHLRKPCAYVKEGQDLETMPITINNNESLVMFDDEEQRGIRFKRQIDPFEYEYKPNKTRCPLLLVADYRFFQEMGASDTKITINYLISLIDRVHKIYNDTTWHDGGGRRVEFDGFNGMGFVIKKILVHSEPTRVRSGEAHYNMLREKWDVRTLLEVFSREYTHKDYCLAHLFTDLKFEGGILGLAYVGSPRRNSVGGICTPEYFKNGYTLYLNSGLSSSRNHYGQRVITREADLVTAHEFGHNWGSEHDPDIPECSPTASQGGSYLMYTYSVSGYDINNKKFSACSLRSIGKVLQAKSGRCFSEPQESFCGNLRVEKNEECDAGLLGTEDNDACCNKFCKLRKQQSALCSDKNSPCCQNCQFMQAGVKCRDAQYATCEQEAQCTGHSADCPRSSPMPDGTPCLERGQCQNGRCVPYCETQNLKSCMCDDLVDACKRCCRMSLNGTCYPVDLTDILPDGTPCFQGFCNKGVCEKTVQDVVERFWDIIEEININKLLVFLRDNVVGAVVLSTALVWIPASCLVSYVDRQRLYRLNEDKCRLSDDRTYFSVSAQSYPKNIISVRVPRSTSAA